MSVNGNIQHVHDPVQQGGPFSLTPETIRYLYERRGLSSLCREFKRASLESEAMQAVVRGDLKVEETRHYSHRTDTYVTRIEFIKWLDSLSNGDTP